MNTIPQAVSLQASAAEPSDGGSGPQAAHARSAVLDKGPLPVPLKLRNAPTPLMKSMGYAGGYRYPHNFSGNYVPEEYLPEALRGQRFYQPGENGEEAATAERLRNWREELERRRAGEERQDAATADAARKLD